MKEEIKASKPILIVGVVILIISICVIFPFEYSKASFIADLKFTYFTLAIAMFTLMYSFMGKHFFKGLILLFCSCIFSIISWFFFFPDNELTENSSKFFEITITILSFFENFAILYIGTVTGIIAGLIFLILNAWLLKGESRYKLFFLRLISYLIIFSIVSILFAKGGDWIFEISEYLKSKN